MKTRIALKLFLLVLFWPAAFLTLPAQTLIDKSGWDLTWSDEFPTGTSVDLTTKWKVGYVWNDDAFLNWNSTSNFNSYASSDALSIDAYGNLNSKVIGLSTPNNVCRISNPAECHDFYYKEGAIVSRYKEPGSNITGFQYGMFEIRCKLGTGGGLYSAFWMAGGQSWPPEVDVFEYDGVTPQWYPQGNGYFGSTVHWTYSPQMTTTDALTIGSGQKTVHIATGKSLVPGMFMCLKKDNNHYMFGNLLSYNSSTGVAVIDVPSISGCVPGGPISNYDFPGGNSCYYYNNGTPTGTNWQVVCARGDCACSTFHTKMSDYNLDEEFHNYTLVWTPTELTWFFDGVEIRTETVSERLPTNARMALMLGMSLSPYTNPADLPGLLNNAFKVDYVRVYKPKSSNTTYACKQFGKQSPANNVASIYPSVKNISASSNLAIVPNSNDQYINVFYRDDQQRLWNYYWNGTTLFPGIISSAYTNVASDITYDSYTNRIYYRTPTNGLEYFVWNGSGYNHVVTGVTNCGGNMVVAANGTIIYRSTDNFMYKYYNSSGTTWTSTQILSSTAFPVKGGLSITNGTLGYIYYQGTNNDLIRVVWSNGSIISGPTRCTTLGNVTSDITSNTTSGDYRAYFRTSDNKLWNYYYDGTQFVLAQFHPYEPSWQNATAGLVYDNAHDILYHRSSDNALWYRFTDLGWNVGGGGAVQHSVIDWNNRNYAGAAVINNTGTIFYKGTDGGLYSSAWKNNQLTNLACNSAPGAGPPVYGIYKTDEESISSTSPTIQQQHNLAEIYPNPTTNNLALRYQLEQNGPVTVSIYSIDSKLMHSVYFDYQPTSDVSEISFDVSQFPAGIYILQVKSKNYSAKLRFTRQ